MNIQEAISSLLFLIFFHINIGYYFETFLESEYIANLLTSAEDKPTRSMCLSQRT